MPQNFAEGSVNVDLQQRAEVPFALEYRSVIEYHNDAVTGSPERFGWQLTWLPLDGLLEAVRAAGYNYARAIRRSDCRGPHNRPRTYIGDRDSLLFLAAGLLRHRPLSCPSRISLMSGEKA